MKVNGIGKGLTTEEGLDVLKTDPTSVLDAQDVGTGDDLIAELDDRAQKLQAILEGADGQDLTEELRAKAKLLLEMLMAEKAAILAGDAEFGSAGALGSDEIPGVPSTLEAGWNGVFEISADSADSDVSGYQSMIESDQKYGDFAGVIYMGNSSDPSNPFHLIYSATDDVSSISVETKGKDLIVTIEMLDGSKESYVIKNGAIRSEAIGFDAASQGLSHGITFDASGAIRFDDGSFKGDSSSAVAPFSIMFWGSEYDDTVYGQQGVDYIEGRGGKDKIFAGAGNDFVWGDYSGGTASQGESDTIDGGAGADTVIAGGGTNDQVVKDGNDVVSEHESIIESKFTVPADFDYEAAGWEFDAESATFVHTDSGSGNEININIPEGYNMAYGEKDGNDLVITFVSTALDANGNPSTFKVRIDDFFKSSKSSGNVTHLVINGTSGDDLIDFSQIRGQDIQQAITINGGAGNDVICEPDSIISTLGVANDSLKESTDNSVDVENLIASEEDSDEQPWNAEIQDGQVVVARNEKHEGNDHLNVFAPDGYDSALAYEDEENYYIVLVGENAGAEADTIVIRVSKEDVESLNDIHIQVTGANGDNIEITPIFIGSPDGFTTDGGSGDDVAFGPAFGRERSGIESGEYYDKPLDVEEDEEVNTTDPETEDEPADGE